MLGYVHPDKLAEQMTWKQLREWIAYAQLEPFGPQVERVYAGTQVAATYNVHRGKDSEPIGWSDVFPIDEDKDRAPHMDVPTPQQWAELDQRERARRWAMMSEEQRNAYLELESKSVVAYMQQHMGAKHASGNA